MTDWLFATLFVVGTVGLVLRIARWIDNTAERRDSYRRNHQAHRK